MLARLATHGNTVFTTKRRASPAWTPVMLGIGLAAPPVEVLQPIGCARGARVLIVFEPHSGGGGLPHLLMTLESLISSEKHAKKLVSYLFLSYVCII